MLMDRTVMLSLPKHLYLDTILIAKWIARTG